MHKRRDFIKISALGLGGMAFVDPVSTWITKENTHLINNAGEYFKLPTYCEVCFWKCSGWVIGKKGKIEKIIGHADDPHCNGRLCPRGTGGIGMYNDEDRLKTPLIRVNEGGKQTFKEASWDEALDYVADELVRIKQ